MVITVKEIKDLMVKGLNHIEVSYDEDNDTTRIRLNSTTLYENHSDEVDVEDLVAIVRKVVGEKDYTYEENFYETDEFQEEEEIEWQHSFSFTSARFYDIINLTNKKEVD